MADVLAQSRTAETSPATDMAGPMAGPMLNHTIWRVTAVHQSEAEDCCGKELAMPMMKNRVPASVMPPNTLILRPRNVMVQKVKTLEIMASPIPISTIMAVLVGDMPATIMKYGALEVNVAPIIWERPFVYRTMRIRRQLMPLKQSINEDSLPIY